MRLKYVALSISIGILAALWTYVSIKLKLPTWAGFIGWAFFFVAGSNAAAILKAGFPMLLGVLLGHVALYGLKLGGELGFVGISILVGICALVLVLLMNWKPLELASAAFCAFAAFFAFTFGQFKTDNFFSFQNILYTLIGLFVGILLGYVSVMIPAWLAPKKA
jgi:hypothetical protein